MAHATTPLETFTRVKATAAAARPMTVSPLNPRARSRHSHDEHADSAQDGARDN